MLLKPKLDHRLHTLSQLDNRCDTVEFGRYLQKFGRKPTQFQKLPTAARDLILLKNTRNIQGVNSASPKQWAPHALPRGKADDMVHLTT